MQSEKEEVFEEKRLGGPPDGGIYCKFGPWSWNWGKIKICRRNVYDYTAEYVVFCTYVYNDVSVVVKGLRRRMEKSCKGGILTMGELSLRTSGQIERSKQDRPVTVIFCIRFIRPDILSYA